VKRDFRNAEELLRKTRIIVLKMLQSSHATRKLKKEVLISRKNVKTRMIPMVRSRNA